MQRAPFVLLVEQDGEEEQCITATAATLVADLKQRLFPFEYTRGDSIYVPAPP